MPDIRTAFADLITDTDDTIEELPAITDVSVVESPRQGTPTVMPTPSESPQPQTQYAIQFRDAQHAVEGVLIALPTTVDAIQSTWDRVEAAEWLTAEEIEAVKARLLGCVEMLDAASFERLKGEIVPTMEPITFEISEENYGLLYRAMQEDGAFWRTVEPTIVEKIVEVEKIITETVEVPGPTVEVKVPTDNSEALQSTNQRLAEVSAELVAMYEKSLRRPTMRDISASERAQQLIARGPEHLRFTLEDLRAEYAIDPEAHTGIVTPEASRIPRIADPTTIPTARDLVEDDSTVPGSSVQMEIVDDEDDEEMLITVIHGNRRVPCLI